MMPNHSDITSQLSTEMNKLRTTITEQIAEQNSLLHQVHKGSNQLSVVASGFASFFTFISSIANTNKHIPVVGNIFQGIAMLSMAFGMMIDPEKTIAEKAAIAVFLGTITAVAIAAVLAGPLFAAILGTVASAAITVIEGVGFLGNVINKYQNSSAYNQKKALTELIENRTIPDDVAFEELLETRAVELTHKIAHNTISPAEKNQHLDELRFITAELNKKNILVGNNPENTAFQLQELYKKRKQQLASLTDTISLGNSSSNLNLQLEEIQLLQSQIVLTDQEINKITAPANKLNVTNMIATEKVAQSFSNFNLALAGSLTTVIGLLLIVGGVAMPPVIVPIMIGLGIGVSAFSLIKFVVEKINQHQENQELERLSAAHKESILNEALLGYQHQLTNQINPALTSSHSKHMQQLMTNTVNDSANLLQEVTPQPPFSIIKGTAQFKEALSEEVEVVTSEEANTHRPF